MDLKDAREAVKSLTRGFAWIEYETTPDCLSAAAKRQGHVIKKHVVVQFRISRKDIESAWETPTGDAEDQGMFFYYKDDSNRPYIHIRPTSSSGGIDKRDITYYLDGKEISLEDIKKLNICTPSGINKLAHEENHPEPIKLSNVIDIRKTKRVVTATPEEDDDIDEQFNYNLTEGYSITRAALNALKGVPSKRKNNR